MISENEIIQAILDNNNRISIKQLAEKVNRSRQTAGTYLSDLYMKGKLYRKKEDGIFIYSVPNGYFKETIREEKPNFKKTKEKAKNDKGFKSKQKKRTIQFFMEFNECIGNYVLIETKDRYILGRFKSYSPTHLNFALKECLCCSKSNSSNVKEVPRVFIRVMDAILYDLGIKARKGDYPSPDLLFEYIR
ncbi:MAG: helix-turn-helix domain-containing protein [Methanosarcinales archaeon]